MSMIFSESFMQTGWYNWLLLPLFIYAGGLCYVALATLRNVFIARNHRKIVPLVGFFEVIIWLTAVSSTIKNLHNVACYLSFAAGYASGIYIGLAIEAKLALGLQLIRIITNKNTDGLLNALQAANVGTTVIEASGSKGPVKVIYTTVKRKDVDIISQLILAHNPNAFFTIEDIRQANHGVFPNQKPHKYPFLSALLPGVNVR